MAVGEKLKENHDFAEGVVWMVLAVPTVLWWKESILWVAIMSLYANTKVAFGAWKSQKAKDAAEDES